MERADRSNNGNDRPDDQGNQGLDAGTAAQPMASTRVTPAHSQIPPTIIHNGATPTTSRLVILNIDMLSTVFIM